MRFRWFVLFLVMPLSLCAVAADFTLCPSAPNVVYRNDGLLVAPLPPLAAWLGATVVEAPDGLITVTRGGVIFRCRVGETTAIVGDQPVQLPLAPYEEFGVVHVPLQPLIAAWGGNAQDDYDQRQVTVRLPNMPTATLFYTPGRSSNGGADLYLMRLDGSDLQQITYGGEANCIAVTADGTHLAYYTQTGDLYLRRADSPMPWRFPGTRDHVAQRTSFMPDGKTLLYCVSRMGEPQYQITRANLDGSDARVLGEGDEPLVSPDGKLLVFTSDDADRKLMCMDSDGGNARSLQLDYISPVAFSPDGTKLLCQKYYPDAKGEDMYAFGCPLIVTPAGPTAGTIYELPPALRAENWYPGSFSPDGRQVTLRRGNEGIWIADANLTHLRPVVQLVLAGQTFRLTFTPDGRHILYDADGALYQIGVDGGGRTRISPPGYTASDRFFTPDGRLLVPMMRKGCWLPAAPPDVLRVNGVLMAPIKPLVKMLGYASMYLPLQTKFIILTTHVTEFHGEIGETAATAKGEKAITLPLAPVLIHGEVYCPLEPLLEALGYPLAVDAARGVATVTSPPGSEEPARVELPIVDVPSLAEVWTAVNRAELYVTYPTGIPPTRLTFDTEANALPTFTTDGAAYLATVRDKTGLRPLRFPLPPAPRELTFGVAPGTRTVPGKTYPVSPRNPGEEVTLLDGGIGLIQRKEGGMTTRLLVKAERLSAPSFTPDGDRIVYLRDGLLYAMLTDGSGKTCLSPGQRVTAYTFAPNGMLFFIAAPPER